MWPFVFVAAVAGSGILLNRFFRNVEGVDHSHVRVSSVSQQTDQQGEEEEEKKNVMEEEEESFDVVKSDALITSVVGDEGVFRFSSLDRGEEGSGSRLPLLKKAELKGTVNNVMRRTTVCRFDKIKNKLMVMDQRNKGRNKISFCLKRRKTGKNAFRNCGSCLSKGNSLFKCGVGFGFMYLLSAGKAEFIKRIVHIEKITEVISNLESGVNKKKLSGSLYYSSCEYRTDMEAVGKNMTYSSVKLACPDEPKVLDMLSNDDGECLSSNLIEEVDLEALEMDKLEAELESELQKIPTEPDSDYFMDCPSTELSVYALECPQEPLGMDSNSSQFNGVSPTELDRKLCHVLIKQQESQIAELETNLYLSHMKLQEKDAELQKLRAIVCSLRDFSLETVSDDEAEDGVVLDEEEEEEHEKEKEMHSNAESLAYPRSVDDGSNKIAVEQRSLRGVKRVMQFDSYANSHAIHNALIS